jgi:hypothetical protein
MFNIRSLTKFLLQQKQRKFTGQKKLKATNNIIQSMHRRSESLSAIFPATNQFRAHKIPDSLT